MHPIVEDGRIVSGIVLDIENLIKMLNVPSMFVFESIFTVSGSVTEEAFSAELNLEI